jgi:hypothetical protein
MTAPIVDYTDAQLRAAWQICRLHSWPASFEATMDDPTRARLVRLHAGHQLRCAARQARRTPAVAPSHCLPPRLPAYPPGYVDHKRAAAGDLDD